MKEKVLIITEDNPEISGLSLWPVKKFFSLYTKLYKFFLNNAINQYRKNSEVLVVTNKSFKPNSDSESKINFYDELWGSINWEAVRVEYWEKARNWHQNIDAFDKRMSLNGINLNDVSEIRIALHLSRSVISYKYLIEEIIEKYRPQRVVTMTLNSPPENFAIEKAKEKKLLTNIFVKINIFKVYPIVRGLFWKAEEKKILDNILSICSGPKQLIRKAQVVIAASHELHLKSIKPLLEKFAENNISVSIATDLQKADDAFNKYEIDKKYYDNYFKYSSLREIKKTYLQYKRELHEILKKQKNNNIEYLEKYMVINFKEKLSQYMGFSAIYIKSADKYLLKENPKALIFISDRGALEFSLAQRAKLTKIPTFLISPNNLMSLDKTNEYKLANYLLVTGEHIKKELMEIGLPENKISIVGDLRFEGFVKNIFDKNTILNKYNLDPEVKYLLLVSTYISTAVPYREKKAAFQLVSNGIKNLKGYKLLIKCHPNENIEVLKSQVEKWGIEGQVVSGNLQEFIYISKVLAQTESMSGFEAIIFNKPVLVINSKQSYEEHIPYVTSKAAIAVSSKEELVYFVEKLERNDKFKDELLLRAKDFCQKYIGTVDGQVSERILNKINSAVNLKPS